MAVTTLLRTREGVFLRLEDLESGTRLFDDEDYLDGAILLTIQGTPILTEIEWDYPHDLWCYIVDGLPEVETKGLWWTYLPDQPIKLTIRKIESVVEVCLDYDDVHRSARCDFAELRKALLTEASRFLTQLDRLFPSLVKGNAGYHEQIAQMLQGSDVAGT